MLLFNTVELQYKLGAFRYCSMCVCVYIYIYISQTPRIHMPGIPMAKLERKQALHDSMVPASVGGGYATKCMFPRKQGSMQFSPRLICLIYGSTVGVTTLMALHKTGLACPNYSGVNDNAMLMRAILALLVVTKNKLSTITITIS